jgi:hypothetical protein
LANWKPYFLVETRELQGKVRGTMNRQSPERDMQNKFSKLAITSFVLGLIGAFTASTRAGGLPVLAIPLGVFAVSSSAAAIWSIHKRAVIRRGTGLAISGACLGAGGTIFSVVFIGGMIFRQMDHARAQQDQFFHLENQMGNSPLADQKATNFTSNLPIIVLHTGGKRIFKQGQTLVRGEVFDAGSGRASNSAKPAYEGMMTIHMRGSTTMQLPKHSFTFHTVDSATNQTKVSLLGLPRDEDWILYAPFEDKTLMRDVLAFQLARKMGHYAPRTKFVELFIQRSSGQLSMRDYAGVYVLMEKIKRGPERVKIAKLQPEDRSEPAITGGYIIKRDHGEHQADRFHTSRGGPYFFISPKADHVTSEQKAWLQNYMNSFESALYGSSFTDARKGYAAYLDVDSFIDAHWLIEAGKNVDGFRYSSFLTKDRGGKLKTEPPWDWNRSFGNANYYGGGETSGWYWPRLRPNELSWYRRLREDPAFAQRCKTRWFELRKNVLDPKQIDATIDEMAAQLKEAQTRNFKRWPILGQQITCNYYVGDSFQDEVQWLKKWINGRIAWIDNQMGRASDL